MKIHRLLALTIGLLALSHLRFAAPSHPVAAEIETRSVASAHPAPSAAASSALTPPNLPPPETTRSPLPALAPPTVANATTSTATQLDTATPGATPAHSAGANPLATRETPADVLRDADLNDPAVRAYVVARLSELDEQRRESAHARAAALGLPLRIDGPGRKVSLLYDFRDDRPLYRTTLNTNAAISTGANLLRDSAAPYGLDGDGHRVGVWDGGSVRSTHQEFGSRVTKRNSSAANDDHATHVAGTIGAAGVSPAAKGMAPRVAIDSYDWDNDYAELTAAGSASATDTTKINLSNHSYGYDAATADMGRYETEARSLDAVAAALPFHAIFWAAGNEQDLLTTHNGYQSITFTGLAKNVLTIGAGNDAVSAGLRTPSAGTLAYFSSLGPCDDGRIKPDLVANGVDLYSPVATSNTAYDGTYSGTSMATPNALGSALLVQQLHAREFSGRRLRASMLKALLIHTADDVGRPGPDYQYGWGYLNVKAAADLVLAHKASLASPKLIEGQLTTASRTATHTFTWDGSSPIRATLSWTDPAGTAQTAADSRTPNLVHDLDLQLTAPDGTTTTLPFVMPFVGTWTPASMTLNATTGVNRVDNVEQVLLTTPTQPGDYTVSVSLPGNLTTAAQIYSLVVTGGLDVEANPSPLVALVNPAPGATLLAGQALTLSATATDLAIGGAPGSVTQVEFLHGTTSLGIDTSAPYSVTWTPPAAGAYTLTAVATDNEGAVATSAPVSITVLSGDGTPAITTFSPASGTAGDAVTITGLNFAAVSAVRFNGADAGFTVVSPTSITTHVPAAALTGPLTVTTPYGTATSPTSFTVLQNPVLISQIYGAGSNTGGTYNADYIELYNRSDITVALAGWSVQYASASGTTWQTAALTGSIAPGRHHLVRLATGGNGAALPTPDTTGSINLSGTQGKIALRNTSTAFTGSSPVGQSGLQDFVGYGSANASETTPAPAPSATTAIFRAAAGASDTGNNAADFTTATPNPRNSTAGQPAAPIISSPATATGIVGQTFSYQITATHTPSTYAATGLPAGLALNTSSGLISGTPSAAGSFTVTLSATNAAGTGTAPLALTISAAGTAEDYVVNFEDGTKAGYAAGNVTLNGLSWNLTEALIGGDSNDFKNGAKAARLRGYSTSVLALTQDIPGGIGSISFSHRRYGSDPQVEWIVETSADAGATWTEAGRFTPAATAATFSAEVTQPAAKRLRIRTAATGTGSNRRANVDDIVVTPAPSGPVIPTFSEWAAGLADPAPSADPDGDGTANLLEYFLGLDPAVRDAAPPVLSLAAGELRLDYRRAKAIAGVTATIEWTSSLADGVWSATGVTDTLLSDEPDHELRRATVPFTSAEPMKFLRLRVTLP